MKLSKFTLPVSDYIVLWVNKKEILITDVLALYSEELILSDHTKDHPF